MILRITIFIILSILYSCNKNDGTSTGNPVVIINMTGSQQNAVARANPNKLWWLVDTAQAYAPPASMLDKNGNTVSLSDFWINISEIEFKLEETAVSGEIDGSDIEFTGPYLVNLFSTNPQRLASGSVSNSSIRRIKYKTKKVVDVSGGNPAGMINSTVYLKGIVSGNNFTIVSGQELVFESSGPKLVQFKNSENLLMQVLTADVIRKIDLSLVTNGVVISESNKVSTAPTLTCPLVDGSATDIYTCFIKAFQKQTKVGKDLDGNFNLEPTEDSVN